MARQFGKHVPEGLLRGNLRRIGRTQLFRHRDVEPQRGVPVASLPVQPLVDFSGQFRLGALRRESVELLAGLDAARRPAAGKYSPSDGRI